MLNGLVADSSHDN